MIALTHFEFENRAVIARRHSQQGAGWRHGHRWPHLPRWHQARRGRLFSDDCFPIQVKKMDKVGPSTSSGRADPTSTHSKP
jgi:hypothetical protein